MCDTPLPKALLLIRLLATYLRGMRNKEYLTWDFVIV